ncbi:unnamed protein product [Darwinula stevensoni]|uniref:Phosphate transporter n=1 Tax=Darwinula stevensoni TaxID=69355 RepID=A0A7R8X9T7_9CRUS|nr:unnamed protein product [Darwinula stevensoni]CAG0889298.1 unnamed protein product [Darwinula stevensoni]
MEPYGDDVLWIVVVGFLMAFLVAFTIGANDVANSFGTSVGSKVLTLKTACILGIFFETAGSILLGSEVTEAIGTEIFNVDAYNGTEKQIMLGALATLGKQRGSGLWQLVATYFQLPISTTHGVVGAIVGFSLVAKGPLGVQWMTVARIAASWVLSPVVSGAISALFFLGVRTFILENAHPVKKVLIFLPIIYAVVTVVNVVSVFTDSPPFLYLDKVPWWGVSLSSLLISILVGVYVRFFLIPHVTRKLTDTKNDLEEVKEKEEKEKVENMEIVHRMKLMKVNESGKVQPILSKEKMDSNPLPQEKEGNCFEKGGGDSNEISNGLNDEKGIEDEESEKGDMTEKGKTEGDEGKGDTNAQFPPTEKLFSFVQILTSVCSSFFHGANDVSNAVGPILGMWFAYQTGKLSHVMDPPIWILAFGGIGISLGLAVWGRRVIKTVGQRLTPITPSSGFTMEMGAAFTVLMASKVGLPISTTHCLIGSIVCVGKVKDPLQGVQWGLFRNIVLTWFITLPACAGVSALIMFILLHVSP